jgi:hypothetical protein
MASTLSTANSVLKEDYKDLKEQINQQFKILAQVEKNTSDIEGRRAIHAIHIGRNSGVGARAEGGTLPTAGNQQYSNTYVPVRTQTGRIKLSVQVIKAMKSNKGSFVRAVKAEMDGLRKDSARDVNRQVWGQSDGVIAACGTTTASSTVQLATTTTVTQLRQIYADGGGLVDIGTGSPFTDVATERLVTAYDASAKTITISGAAVTTDANDRIVRSGAGGATDNSGLPNDGQKELTGLQTIVDSSGYAHGITAASVPVWAAGEYANGGTNRAISENLVNTAIQEQEIVSGQAVDMLVASAGVQRAAAATMQAIRRNVDTVALKAGYSGIQWSAPLEGNDSAKPIALISDRDCPENALYGLDTSALVYYVEQDWDWMQEDGAILSRVDDELAYEATLYKIHELATRQRNSSFKIADLTAA